VTGSKKIKARVLLLSGTIEPIAYVTNTGLHISLIVQLIIDFANHQLEPFRPEGAHARHSIFASKERHECGLLEPPVPVRMN
jgi:hypothetical protein